MSALSSVASSSSSLCPLAPARSSPSMNFATSSAGLRAPHAPDQATTQHGSQRLSEAGLSVALAKRCIKTHY